MKKLILVALVAAFAIPATANAQWADPGGTWSGPVSPVAATLDEVDPGPALEPGSGPEPVQEALAGPVEEVVVTGERPPPPCNPYEGCGVGLPPGSTITTPARPGDPCNPYRGCGVTLPPGVVFVPPPRPGIPCTRYSLHHCAPGEIPLW